MLSGRGRGPHAGISMKNSINQPSQRQLRVAEQIKHVLAGLFARGDFHTEELRHVSMLTVTEVQISPDLKHATAYVVANGSADLSIILPALVEEAHEFQREINRQTQLKFTPKLQFRKDDIFDKAQRLEGIFSTIKYSDQE